MSILQFLIVAVGFLVLAMGNKILARLDGAIEADQHAIELGRAHDHLDRRDIVGIGLKYARNEQVQAVEFDAAIRYLAAVRRHKLERCMKKAE